ncbi:MAG TPA: PKD domain-containing protein [Prolixibacteraceae bacterium]|nr:PKD domain-containing protein [Prolixibacteraceae bacterium]
MKFVLLTFLFLFLRTILVSGQVNPCHKSTEGKNFWFGFMESRHHQSGHKNEITLTSVYECNYKIFIGKSTTPYTVGILAANSPMQITIDWTLVEAIGSESIQEKAIHLVSDLPLNVYALNWSPNSADVALIFPAESLGNEYYAMCYTPHLSKVDPNNGNAEGKNSELMIVASEDNTVVSITPSVVTDHLKPANLTYSITINKGELYQVQSANTEALNQGDLTGTYIKSNKPVALFSGSYSTTVPGDLGECCFDHLYEQIPPLQTWGRKFIAVPLKSREKDTYRVLASEDNTTIRIGNQTPIMLNKGQKSEFMLMYTEPSLIESDKPVLLAQYSNSQSVDKQFTNGDGDPFMVIVSPVNQTRERVAFVAYKSVNIKDKYFINIVVKDDAIGKIILDGVPVSFQSLVGTGFSYAQVKISEGSHIIESTEQGKGFIAYVYGFGGVESYGYGVGFNLDIVLDLGSNVNASGEKLLVRCDGADPLNLNAGNGFDTYHWNTGEITSAIKVANAGWYKVKVSTIDGCQLVDSVELQVSKPVVDLGSDRTICNPETTVLDAGSQFASLLWSTTQTDPRITVSKSGNYFVEALNKFGCKAKDTVAVTFVDKPKIDFSRLDTLICGKKSAILDVTADKGSFTVQRLSDGFSSIGLETAVPDFGTYDLRIKATDVFSCYSDSVIRVGFHKTPVVHFSVDSTTCYGYNLDVRYSGDANIGASDFAWVFGGDTINRGVGLDAYLVPLGINRATRDLKLIVTDQGCPNDKTLHDIKVIPNLQMWVTDSLGCEPFTTQFMANNTETVTYDWDFGDGNHLGGSTANPKHTYQSNGFYPVKLKVTTNKGCTNEVRIDSMVYVAPIPTVGFTSLPAECLENENHSIFYSGSGNQLDNYLWNLSEFDADEVIQNPDTTQGPLIFNLKNKPQSNIGLKVISKYGCKSEEANVLVKRKPDFTMNSSSVAGCAPLDILFTGITTDPVDLVSYTWDFGNGTKGSGNQVNQVYNEPNQKYDIVLTGLSATTGCSETLISKELIHTYPKPKAVFSMDNHIVYNDKPTVNFLNSSTGANLYAWDFGDGSTSDQKDASHYFAVTGYRTVLLEVFNEFQCSDTVSHQLLVAFDRIFPPNAFSPNAPNEIDREFKLGTNGIATEGYHFTIISRWNDIVFEAKEEIKGWNGLMQNGSPAPAGNYVWILDFSDFLGRRHRQTGTVTLVY